MTEREFVEFIGPKATLNYQKTGILASITIAQACQESGYGSTELAQNANNFFGMKTSLSNNTWKSVWDGVSKYTKDTIEEYTPGQITHIQADFRKYPNIDASIEDHSLYLSQAKNGNALRYAGLTIERDYRVAAQIIKNGGYATDSLYVQRLCNLVERWNLTQYDKMEEPKLQINQNPSFEPTHNTTARPGKIEYLVMHYVGATGDARANIEYYNYLTTTEASADFYVGHNGDIWQYNPDPKARYCWAVGGNRMSNQGGSLFGIAKNANCVSIEMCVKNDTTNRNANSPGWVISDATYNSAVALAKYLLKLYGLSIDHLIRHFDVNGKYCPGVVGWNIGTGSEAKWQQFKNDVANGSIIPPSPPEKHLYRIRTEWINEKSQIGAYENLDYAKAACPEGFQVFDENGNVIYANLKQLYRIRKDWADEKSQIGAYENLDYAKAACPQGYSVYDVNGIVVYSKNIPAPKPTQPYTVRVTADSLNVRKGPSVDYEVVNVITDKGIYTIVDQDNNWGLLKAYADNRDGWISLAYTNKN